MNILSQLPFDVLQLEPSNLNFCEIDQGSDSITDIFPTYFSFKTGTGQTSVDWHTSYLSFHLHRHSVQLKYFHPKRVIFDKIEFAYKTKERKLVKHSVHT